ncbi:DUF2798 domain-containing protein [Tetragenococcus halophilus]|uniref:DUF2798 domain-containing protein n=1 Tax=Tetragenococcus halophilus TaxID=51669 RepID=A0A3G5FHI6_TETHA|nr:DUF2798 domain-containing protein [Tetragenococcus halophilus]AYW49800.1 DUF2798 domain-containing protein [Tetragenococcus halophilus]GBD64510.1 hypothetical protein TEHD23766T_1937 [Tetragenococcus halophilus subsp. flandriensis]
MPTNKRESLFFTSVMCFLMVLGMSAYNLLLHHSFSLLELVKGFVPGFVLAFILDEFVVGNIAKKIVFTVSTGFEKTFRLILRITLLMVLGMVTCMSLFGLFLETGWHGVNLPDYLYAWRMNLMAALPLQLFLVGPFSRYLLKNIQAKN